MAGIVDVVELIVVDVVLSELDEVVNDDDDDDKDELPIEDDVVETVYVSIRNK